MSGIQAKKTARRALRGIVFGAALAAATLRATGARAQAAAPKISGFIQLIATHDNSALGGQTAGPNAARSSLALKRIRVSVIGAASPKTSYDMMLAGEAPAGFTLFNAFVDHQLVEKLLVVRAGQFKYPFSLEGYESGKKRPLIIYAEGTDVISKKLGITGGAFRDIGAQLGGNYRPSFTSLANIDYAFAVVNGSGPVANGAKDNNDFKDVVARVQLNLPPNVLVGASLHSGRAENQGQAYAQHERSYGVHAQATLFGGKTMARAEYLSGFYRNANGSLKDVNPLSWYALVSQTVAADLDLLARYEDWQNNRLVARGHLRTTTLGATYRLSGAVKLQFNYLLRRAQGNAAAPADGNTKATGNDIRDLAALQLQVEY